MYLTLAWLLFYELDPYAIAKLAGAEAVAYYSIGLTCLAFFRSIFGTLFNPFNARFNHFIARSDFSGLNSLTKNVICILLPAVVFPTLSLALLSKPFVYSWVGNGFEQSVKIVTLLSLCNIFGFINYPAGILAVATKRINFIYIISTVQIIIYWGGISIFFHRLGYIVFAYFELTCFTVTSILYTYLICRFLKASLFWFIKTIIAPAILPTILLIVMLLFIRNYLPAEKSKLYMLEVFLSAIGSVIPAVFLYYFTSNIFRNYINQLLVRVKYSFANFISKKYIH